MGLLGFGKKKEEEPAQRDCGERCKPSEIVTKKIALKVKDSSCCGGACSAETMAQAEKAKQSGAGIKVLGAGCSKCNALALTAKEALAQLGMDTTVNHVTDFAQIAAYGVMTTPALVVDGKVVSLGKVLKKDEIITILQKARG